MLTLGWALAAAVGALAGMLVIPTELGLHPHAMDLVFVSAFTAAVVGGLDSPPGAVVGGLVVGLLLSYVSGYVGSDVTPLAVLVLLLGGAAGPPGGLFSAGRRRGRYERHAVGDLAGDHHAGRAPAEVRPCVAARPCCATSPWPRSPSAVLVPLTYALEPFRNFQLATVGRLPLRDRRADRPHRAQRPALARARRADGGRRVHGARCCQNAFADAASPAAGCCSVSLGAAVVVTVVVGRGRRAGRRPAARARTWPASPSPSRSSVPASPSPSTSVFNGDQGLSVAGRAAAGWRSARTSRSSAGRPGSRWPAALLTMLLLANLVRSRFGRTAGGPRRRGRRPAGRHPRRPHPGARLRGQRGLRRARRRAARGARAERRRPAPSR